MYAVNDISFHPYGTFSTAGSDGTINFWDKESKTRLKSASRLTRLLPSARLAVISALFKRGPRRSDADPFMFGFCHSFRKQGRTHRFDVVQSHGENLRVRCHARLVGWSRQAQTRFHQPSHVARLQRRGEVDPWLFLALSRLGMHADRIPLLRLADFSIGRKSKRETRSREDWAVRNVSFPTREQFVLRYGPEESFALVSPLSRANHTRCQSRASVAKNANATSLLTNTGRLSGRCRRSTSAKIRRREVHSARRRHPL